MTQLYQPAPRRLGAEAVGVMSEVAAQRERPAASGRDRRRSAGWRRGGVPKLRVVPCIRVERGSRCGLRFGRHHTRDDGRRLFFQIKVVLVVAVFDLDRQRSGVIKFCRNVLLGGVNHRPGWMRRSRFDRA
ncbi:hypothetical protein Pla52o_38930 [Novipirellula galeiformis]|uniref:Uncharacterized protein n=1 Tax=Novipirellula galeiformis TaxID=2528004 RepID=A0A5C6CEI1_9BACT|nr:hypothetical protein Pla52o_38930 [Novipirellula galeiformis]